MNASDNAFDGIAAAGGVLVKWDVDRFRWRTPDSVAVVDGITVEGLAKSGRGMFCAWRVPTGAAPIKLKGRPIHEAEPVVFRLMPTGSRVREWSVEVNTQSRWRWARFLKSATWETRGCVFAADEAEAIRFAFLAGLVFASRRQVRAVALPLPRSAPLPE